MYFEGKGIIFDVAGRHMRIIDEVSDGSDAKRTVQRSIS